MSNGRKKMARVIEDEFDLSNLSTQLSKVVDTNAKLLKKLELEHQLLLESRKNREIVEKEFLELKPRLESTRNGIAKQDKFHSQISRQSGILERLRGISDGLENFRSLDTTISLNLPNFYENSKLPDIVSPHYVSMPSKPTVTSNPGWTIFLGTDISSTVQRACLQKNITKHSRQRSRPHCPRKWKR